MTDPSAEDAPLSLAEAVRHAAEALRGGEPMVSVVLIEQAGGAESMLGRRLLVWEGRRRGTLGDPRLDERARTLAQELLAGGGAGGAQELEIEGAAFTLYLEVHRPPAELVIVGAGHIARPLCHLGAMLGLRVTVLDDRPHFATRERFPEAERVLRADFSDPFREVPLGPGTHLVLVTRGHKYDYDALRDVLHRPIELTYVGMVGSRRRVRAAFEQLAREKIPRERLLRVHAPIGLDLGAETPEEIALAIAAEIVRLRRGGTGESLRDRERVVERFLGKSDVNDDSS
ncbi:MAG TPA: XdhC/CoxI family protein [Longimicrobiaceae bacterium]|nr:XdhC/CoxI family protein [Longimicrobiaceae bacterium]